MKLKEFVECNGIKINHFAKVIGVSRAQLWKIMYGKIECPLEVAKKIHENTQGKVSLIDLLNLKEYLPNGSSKRN